MYKNISKYTNEILKRRYKSFRLYIDETHKIKQLCNNEKIRMFGLPEDISENIIKQICNNKLNDVSTSRVSTTGDLSSIKEGKQECKCFTSNGPISFSPSSNFDVLYLLDARNWLNDKFILYKCPHGNKSETFKNIKINKNQTFEDQCNQKRRPRITWNSLSIQLKPSYIKVYDGTFDNIFIPLEEVNE